MPTNLVLMFNPTLSPCHGLKQSCRVGGHPTRSGVNTLDCVLATVIISQDRITAGHAFRHRNRHEATKAYENSEESNTPVLDM